MKNKVETIKTDLVSDINGTIKLNPQIDTNNISDGYHTFGELYDHRIELFIAVCRLVEEIHLLTKIMGNEKESFVWKSLTHSDGSSMKGWFVMGIYKNNGMQITYHLPISKWEQCEFAETLLVAPEYDGHTSSDVLERIKYLI